MVRRSKGGLPMILSHAKIEEIAAAVTKDFNLFFFGQESNEGKRMPQVTPIDQFAREYLHLSVSFENLSTDGSFCGLTAYLVHKFRVNFKFHKASFVFYVQERTTLAAHSSNVCLLPYLSPPPVVGFIRRRLARPFHRNLTSPSSL